MQRLQDYQKRGSDLCYLQKESKTQAKTGIVHEFLISNFEIRSFKIYSKFKIHNLKLKGCQESPG